MREQWLPVPSRPGYLISSAGRVRSPRGKLCSPSTSGGYLVVNAGGKTTGIHRMVAEAFVPNPDGLPCVNHIDGNKQNNEPANLEWCTKAHNTKHAMDTGLIRSPKGEGNPFAKLTEADVLSIRKLFARGFGSKEIAEFYGMDRKSMDNIRAHRTWRHLRGSCEVEVMP